MIKEGKRWEALQKESRLTSLLLWPVNRDLLKR
nr:MAG TPA: hypothetical protein [Caudoviricetes sp.]